MKLQPSAAESRDWTGQRRRVAARFPVAVYNSRISRRRARWWRRRRQICLTNKGVFSKLNVIWLLGRQTVAQSLVWVARPSGSLSRNAFQAYRMLLTQQTARRRRRGSMRKLRKKIENRRELISHGTREAAPRPRRTNQIQLGDCRQDFRFLFRFFSGRDGAAEIAGMSAVEGLRHCFSKGSVPDILKEHRGPCDRLQRQPMEAERKAERDDRRKPSDRLWHRNRLLGPVLWSKALVQVETGEATVPAGFWYQPGSS